MNNPDQKGEEFQIISNSLPTSVVRQLSKINPVQSALSIMWNIGLIILFITIALLWWNPVVIILAIIGLGGCQHGLFVLAHEAAHYRLFNTRWVNDMVGRCCGTIGGVSMCVYRVIHRLHHNNLYSSIDPDIPLMGGYPRGTFYLVKKLIKDLSGLTAYKTYSYFFGLPSQNDQTEAVNRPLDDTSPRLKKAALVDLRIVLGFHFIALITAIITGWGMEYFLLWILPLITVLQFILRLRAVLEHGAIDESSVPVRARTNLVPKWIRWWLFPHHVNYHIEHHLYPSIPHYHLPEAHQWLKSEGVLNDAQVFPRRAGRC